MDKIDIDKIVAHINCAIQDVDENLSYKDLAKAIGIILKEDYGEHNFKPFVDLLKKELNL